jgi:hypothetical protein
MSPGRHCRPAPFLALAIRDFVLLPGRPMPQRRLFACPQISMFRAAIGCLILLTAPAAATASTITFAVTGTVSKIDPDLMLALGPNPTLSATYTFDSGLLDLYTSGAAAGFHGDYGPALSLTITVGNFTGTFDGGVSCSPATSATCSLIKVYNDPDDEEYQMYFRNVSGQAFAGFVPYSFEMVLLGNAGSTSFSSDALPVVAPYVPGFDDFNEWRFNFAGADIKGSVTSITAVGPIAPVPEPGATVTLLGIGLLGLAGLQAKRKQN